MNLPLEYMEKMKALLGEDYEPGAFEVSETGPDSKSVVVGENAWSITETGEVQHNGKYISRNT